MAVRFGFLALFIIGGLIWWPIFFLAALSIYALVSDLAGSDTPPPDEWYARRWTTTSADPRWRDDFQHFCESPAESAFLSAMINEFDLKPQKGILRNGELKLDLQVKIANYRADFLAQDWLVIEIDGAAWHSSLEAIDRDRERDKEMRTLGYQTIRIPAKTVFDAPKKAVDQVRAALSAGKSRPAFQNTSARPSSLLDSIRGINDKIALKALVQRAMASPELIFHTERCVIDRAFEYADRDIKLEQYLGNDVHKRNSYVAHHSKLSKALERHEQKKVGIFPSPEVKIEIVPLIAPPRQGSVEADALIRQAFDRLVAERSAYLAKQRDRVSRDPRLPTLIQKYFDDLDYPQLWNLLSLDDTRRIDIV